MAIVTAICFMSEQYVKSPVSKPGQFLYIFLPVNHHNESGFDKKVFFGAISMYLREKVGFLRNMPAILDKFFDSRLFLKLAAKQAGTTSTEGLEELTLNMIEGDNAFRKNEVDRLVKYLMKDGKPDIIHLSNALILGIARQLKKRIDVKIVCSLLNEDDWIDDMAEPFSSRAWKMIAKEAGYVDVLLLQAITIRNFSKVKPELKVIMSWLFLSVLILKGKVIQDRQRTFSNRIFQPCQLS